MKQHLHSYRLLLIAAAICTLAAFWLLGARIGVEQTQRQVDVVISYEDTVRLANASGVPVQEWLTQLADAGVRELLVTPDEQAEPDIVFVGITSPKKERLIERFRELGAKGAFVGVGGSFDVVSGNIPRAPMWMQRANLEWLFRMMQEPKRLVKRYVVGNTRFYMLLRKESKRSKAND